MDAREYLNRKGVGLDRDPDRPNTLEEKAWERARGAGSHRPNSGTPYDWEDWERYHDDLAEGADTLEQKIDKEAHRKALAHEKEQAEKAQAAVGHFTPSAKPIAPEEKTSPEPPATPAKEPANLQLAYRALAATALSRWFNRRRGPACINQCRADTNRLVARCCLCTCLAE